MTKRSLKNSRNRATPAVEQLEGRTLLSVARPAYNTGSGFFALDGRVYDANGEEFIIRGINQNQWWGNPAENLSGIDQIAKTGVNAVRAVTSWTDGGANTPAERRTIVERYLANNIVPIIEDHAATTSADHENPAALATIVDKWLDPANLSWLQQYEQKIILNIANEWGPNSTVWRDTYITQIQRLRNAGVKAMIMVDAGGWGQEINTIKSWAPAVLAADPQKNVVFSIHFYSQWRTEERNFEVGGGTYDVLTQLTAVKNLGLPIVVGEFSWEGVEFAPYRARRVIEICEQNDIGYMGWAWNHNNPNSLDIIPGTAYQYNSNADFSQWGDIIVNDPDYGIKATSVRATVFAPAVPRFVLEKTSVSVPEGGIGKARVRLSAPPASNVTINLTKLGGGDGSLALAGSTVTFTPANWNQYQSVLLSAATDVDSTIGSARFQLAAAGMTSTDVIAKEIESTLPLGAFTRNPTDDRDTQSDSAAGTNSAVSASRYNFFYQKFDLAGIGGKAVSATLRLYKSQTTPSNITARIWHAIADGWTQNGAPTAISYPIATRLLPAGAGYVEFDVSSLIASELNGDRVVTLAITTNSDNWTQFQTREGVNKPQLIINAAEAVPPVVLTSSYDATSAAHQVRFGFDELVGASLSASDLVLQNMTDPSAMVAVSTLNYDAATNTASFGFAPATLPDGRYMATLFAPGVADAAGNALPADATISFAFLLGDANSDSAVDLDDFTALAAGFGQPRPYSGGDFDYNGNVSLDDFTILASQFGKSLAQLRTTLIAPAASGISADQINATTTMFGVRSIERLNLTEFQLVTQAPNLVRDIFHSEELR